MGIETKSIGALIDELITADLKTWFAQEINFEVNKRIEAGELAQDDPEALRLKAEGADKAQAGNLRRSQLMRAIDNYFGDKNVALQKTYGTESEEEPLWVRALAEPFNREISNRMAILSDGMSWAVGLIIEKLQEAQTAGVIKPYYLADGIIHDGEIKP